MHPEHHAEIEKKKVVTLVGNEKIILYVFELTVVASICVIAVSARISRSSTTRHFQCFTR